MVKSTLEKVNLISTIRNLRTCYYCLHTENIIGHSYERSYVLMGKNQFCRYTKIVEKCHDDGYINLIRMLINITLASTNFQNHHNYTQYIDFFPVTVEGNALMT